MSDILIVDDERDIRELISDILKDEGYQCQRTALAVQFGWVAGDSLREGALLYSRLNLAVLVFPKPRPVELFGR